MGVPERSVFSSFVNISVVMLRFHLTHDNILQAKYLYKNKGVTGGI